MSLAPSPCTRRRRRAAGAVALRRDGVEVAGEQDERPVAALGAPASTHVSPASRGAGAQQRRATCAASARLVARLRRDVDELERPRGEALAEVGVAQRRAARLPYAAVRYCGIDVSAKPGQPAARARCTSAAARTARELVATFYAPGTSTRVARTILGLRRRGGRRRSTRRPGRRLDLLARRTRRCARALGLPDGRYERMRVCDALLFRRGLPLYPVPAAGQAPRGWERGWRSASSCSPRSRRSGCTGPAPARRASRAPVGDGALRFGRLCETYPDAVFCALLGHRPSPKRTPWGLQQRIAALRLRGVVDDDGGLWHRTLDELDACAAAYAAYALADGRGSGSATRARA